MKCPSIRQTPFHRRLNRHLRLEPLEPRIALHAGHLHGPVDTGIEWFPAPDAGFPGADVQTAAADTLAANSTSTGLVVPAYNSLPGAPVSIYLDFDGDMTTDWPYFSPSITTPPYDQDGNLTSFSAGELDSINKIWGIVAEDFSPFNINVTTVPPASFADGAAIRVDIGGDGAWTGGVYGGYAYIDGFTNGASNTVFVFSSVNQRGGDPKFVGDAASHESGHSFGLQHQSEYDANGAKAAEYYKGPGDGRAPIMGISYAAARGLWWYGTSAVSATTYQDDMAVVSRPQNGFGLRIDEAGHSAATATPLVSPEGPSVVAAEGVITQTGDTDYWSFTADAGSVLLTVSVPQNNDLDATARLLDAAGNVLVDWQDPGDSYGVTVAATLPSAGFYRLAVGSHGNYGDVGQYSISGTIVPTTNFLSAPTGLTATATTKSQINLHWSDNANGETGYSVERSSDGVTFVQVAQLVAGSVSYYDSGLARLATYSYHVRAIASGTPSSSDYSNTVSATTLDGAPMSASNLTASFNKKLTLRWNDNSNDETGFKVQRSTDNKAWSNLATLSANATTYDTTKPAKGVYYFRIVATNALADAKPSNVISVDTKGVVGVVAAATASVGGGTVPFDPNLVFLSKYLSLGASNVNEPPRLAMSSSTTTFVRNQPNWDSFVSIELARPEHPAALESSYQLWKRHATATDAALDDLNNVEDFVRDVPCPQLRV